ncbi:uncharacterized protein LOC9637193 isoform X2 [Selaginella moellendorffii]|uniref:uncharacterized protein LOC9637193 isoform X2 n=1 Tax=Selaginella moellendorffii TaxID=88036 RepID=UPI000D1CE005|nr:uncharacterized protein LOC9637193 isoform X2 [Selaginella moellendorffii]|eukprot:XP_024535400.1 uncharacterized protein LOC9637193 isoform X2 [Selaginella moellendorffii]
MDDATLHQVVQQHGISVLGQHHQPISEHAPSSLVQSLALHVSFDHGYFLTVRAIQELRDKRNCSVSVGIGGPSGSGKTSLAARIASVLGGVVISMENYHDPRLPVDDSNDKDSVDFDLLIKNLEDLLKGKDITVPSFDFQQKKRTGFKPLKAPKSGVVIVDGTYALHAKLRSFLDIRVAVVGGVHFSLLSKVRRDIGDTFSLDHLLDSIFPMFRTHIEPDLHHAQIRISNTFVSSLREPYYILKCEKQVLKTSLEFLFSSSKIRHEQFIEMYLRPPTLFENSKPSDWIRMRQCGIRYDLAESDQRIVDKNFVIKPKVEFEVGKTTLGGLLALGYQVAVSYKRDSAIMDNGKVAISLESLDDLDKTFVQLKGTDRKVVSAEATKLGLEGPWITKSYMEMILEKKGPPRMDSPPLPSSAFLTTMSSPTFTSVERNVVSPRPLRVKAERSYNLDMWTRSPTKSDVEPLSGSWHITTNSGMTFRGDSFAPTSDVYFPSDQEVSETSPRESVKLLPMPEVFDFDRGLLLAVQAVQTLLNKKGAPIIVGIGGPSGSGKTSLAHKMANIVGCEVISMENYFKTEEIKEFKYDDFTTLDLALLLKNIEDAKTMRPTRIPVFDFERNVRSGTKELEVSDECGVVIVEGVYALHPDIRGFLDMSIAVVGGVHSHLVTRVMRDLEQTGRSVSRQEVMTTVFPMFQQHIEPHLMHAHLKICNDFDPVHSPESSMFVLKSSKEVAYEEIAKVLDRDKMTTTVQTFTDIYFHLPGLPSTNNHYSESKWIRVRNCEGRFALLIREPIREGNFIIQPRVDFDISVRTVAGLLSLGYQAVAYIEATATIYQDDKLLIEVDHLKNISTPYIQIKGSNKEAVATAGHALKLDGNYTTSPYIEIILANRPAFGDGITGVHDSQAARLQELVDFVQAQGGNPSSETLASPALSVEGVLDGFDARLKRLERWQIINTVLWTFFVSAFIGYVLYQRSARRPSR